MGLFKPITQCSLIPYNNKKHKYRIRSNKRPGRLTNLFWMGAYFSITSVKLYILKLIARPISSSMMRKKSIQFYKYYAQNVIFCILSDIAVWFFGYQTAQNIIMFKMDNICMGANLFYTFRIQKMPGWALIGAWAPIRTNTVYIQNCQ